MRHSVFDFLCHIEMLMANMVMKGKANNLQQQCLILSCLIQPRE